MKEMKDEGKIRMNYGYNHYFYTLYDYLYGKTWVVCSDEPHRELTPDSLSSSSASFTSLFWFDNLTAVVFSEKYLTVCYSRQTNLAAGEDSGVFTCYRDRYFPSLELVETDWPATRLQMNVCICWTCTSLPTSSA